MRFAADLHLHSRHSKAVSPAMTLEGIASMARRKGLDLLGTSDCLQPEWLRNLEEKLIEAEPGLFRLRPELDEELLARLPEKVRTDLRFVLSTEVHCAPAGSRELEGLHHLLYFRTFAAARKMARELEGFGDLRDGRPRLILDSRRLLELAHTQGGNDCRFAPAHVFNPFFSALGSKNGAPTLEKIFGKDAASIRLAEMGLTSTPPMCRRVSTLDRCALFSCSDAHSLENLGRECTLIDAEADFGAVFDALAGAGPGKIVATLKYPLERTRYFRNRCLVCQKNFEDTHCPVCKRELLVGSHDRLEIVADRSEPVFTREAPPWRMLVPLRELIADHLRCSADAPSVQKLVNRLIEAVGSERYVLTKATEEELANASARPLAREIVRQRNGGPVARDDEAESPASQHQLALF